MDSFFSLFYLWQSLHERQFVCTQSDSFISPPARRLSQFHMLLCDCVCVRAGPIHSRQLWIVYLGQFLSSLATFLILSFPFFGSFCVPPSFSAVVIEARLPFDEICLRFSFEWPHHCVTLGRRIHSIDRICHLPWLNGYTYTSNRRWRERRRPNHLLLDFTLFRISDDPIICCVSQLVL